MTTDATRARESFQHEQIMAFSVGSAVTAGFAVKMTASGQVDNCGAGEDGIGVATETSTTAGAKVGILLFGPVKKVKVGTGGATRGACAKMATDGFTDLTLGGGTTSRPCFGIFLETGVVGDEVALMMTKFSGVSS